MKYIIVKFAEDGVWNFYFESDPKLGAIKDYSCHDTYAGKCCHIMEFYEKYEKAYIDLMNLRYSNPSGGYDVCVLTE